MQPKDTKPRAITPLRKPRDLEEFISNHWNDVLSDHAAQIMPITSEIYLLSWNIMTMGRGRNNAYCKIEDPQKDYKPRLTRIAEELARQVKTIPQLGLIALQEVPYRKDLRNHFFLKH